MKFIRFLTICIVFYLLIIIAYELERAPSKPENNQKYLSIKIFDVGQGDAILITTPNKRRILIDGGPNYEIDNYLQREMPLEACKLDMVILTHPHSDHMRGLHRVLQRCSVDILLFNDVDYSSKIYYDWRELVQTSPHVRQVKEAFAGDKYIIDGVDFYVLWPTPDYLESNYLNVNNISTVLFMDFDENEAMFLGDVEIESLLRIDISQISHLIDGPFEFYKASHHGAVNGLYEPFILELMPQNVAFSAGVDNKYGHPHPKVLEFYENIGATIHRTDLNQTIEFKMLYNK